MGESERPSEKAAASVRPEEVHRVMPRPRKSEICDSDNQVGRRKTKNSHKKPYGSYDRSCYRNCWTVCERPWPARTTHLGNASKDVHYHLAGREPETVHQPHAVVLIFETKDGRALGVVSKSNQNPLERPEGQGQSVVTQAEMPLNGSLTSFLWQSRPTTNRFHDSI